jgi:hypothetical protein
MKIDVHVDTEEDEDFVIKSILAGEELVLAIDKFFIDLKYEYQKNVEYPKIVSIMENAIKTYPMAAAAFNAIQRGPND